MTDKTVPPRPIVLSVEGVEYFLAFDFNAMCDVEEDLSEGWDVAAERLNSGSIRFTEIRSFVAAAINAGFRRSGSVRRVTLMDAGDVLATLMREGRFNDALLAVGTALNACMPQASTAAGEDDSGN